MRELRVPFSVLPSQLLEPPPGLMPPAAYARKLALAKANLVAQKVGRGWVLGADTVVVRQGEILGKPADFSEACRMLSRLQGTTHRVITAVALVKAGTSKKKVAHEVSEVTLKPLSLQEIGRIAGKNLDKAGAYAVQEKRDPIVRRIKGSYSNVVGLPLELVKKLLKSLPEA